MYTLLLIGINAKYTHSNLAIRYMRAYADLPIFECSINDDIFSVYRKLSEYNADYFCFSSYIWNIEFIKKLCPMLKNARPDMKIILGGPEAGYDCDTLLKTCSWLYACITGEGEDAVLALKNGVETSKVPNLVYRENGVIKRNPVQKTDLSNLIFPYTQSDLQDELRNRILYFETARGCLFHCSYCLSSAEGKTRFFPMDYVKNGLLFFMQNKVPLIKFVDRTFNENNKRACEIVSFILENNIETRFHFEIAPQLLTDAFITLCAQNPDWFQFEMGIQTINIETMHAIHRPYQPEKTAEKIKKIPKSIHIHLDLIVGLPFETMQTFHDGFNFVYELQPQMLQIGFLKLLKHTAMYQDAKHYNIITTDFPPFEVLSTNTLSPNEIIDLKKMEIAFDRIYNSGAFTHTLRDLNLKDPFTFYMDLGQKLYKTEYTAPLSRSGLYIFMCEYAPQTKKSLAVDFLTYNRKAMLPDIFLDNVPNAKELHKKLSALPQFQNLRFRLVFTAGCAFAVTDKEVIEVTDIIPTLV